MIVDFVRGIAPTRPAPLIVAIDGPSGAGKSSLAPLVAARLSASVIPLDDFFSGEIPGARWDTWSPAERATHVVDWQRVRSEVLVPLIAGRRARWHPFDFSAGPRPDGSYTTAREWRECDATPVVLLEGAYSGRPELSDVVDLAILVDAPLAVRHVRLRGRESVEFLHDWHARWDAVEAHYFANVSPPSRFDLVVSTTPSAASSQRSAG
ncbi:MAG: (d)CMP kinase [Gemmatimonadaceae bacterium]|nr:(d)CMP kinase [Gemmatimonadaceae bacterium]